MLPRDEEESRGNILRRKREGVGEGNGDLGDRRRNRI